MDRILLEKLTGYQLVKRFSLFSRTRRFIISFTSARDLSLSWARLIQSIPPNPRPEHPSLYYPPIYAWASQVVSFHPVCTPKEFIRLTFPPCMLHNPATLFFTVWFLFLWGCSPTQAIASSFMMFVDHTHNDALQSVGILWTSDQLVTTLNTRKTQTTMPPAGFEPKISASERPQTYSGFDHLLICGEVQIIKLLVTYFSPFPCYVVPLRPLYSPQNPVLKHQQPTFLPPCERPCFTPIQNKRKNYIFIYLNL